MAAIQIFLLLFLSLYWCASRCTAAATEGNDTTIDWVQSLLQDYEGKYKSMSLYENDRDNYTESVLIDGSSSSSSNNTNDMETSASQRRYRVTHVNPNYDSDHHHHHDKKHHHHHHHHYADHHHHHRSDHGDRYHSEHSGDNHRSSARRPYHSRESETVVVDRGDGDVTRKEDPDYGQHYDSDGHRYDFGYDVKDKEGALTFRKETGDAKSLKGSYGIRDVDGRLRIVRYVADEKGFRAKVETNEPGTGSEDAANVYFNGYDAEKIPSHDVLHKDRGQHSFKHGHYNRNSPVDAALYDDPRDYVDDATQEEMGTYRLHDQIPMEIQPALAPRVRVAPVPLEANILDLDDPESAGRTPFKEYAPYNQHHSTVHHHSNSHDDHSYHRIPRPSMYPSYRVKRRQDSKLTGFTYNIPYSSLTGFHKTRYY